MHSVHICCQTSLGSAEAAVTLSSPLGLSRGQWQSLLGGSAVTQAALAQEPGCTAGMAQAIRRLMSCGDNLQQQRGRCPAALFACWQWYPFQHCCCPAQTCHIQRECGWEDPRPTLVLASRLPSDELHRLPSDELHRSRGHQWGNDLVADEMLGALLQVNGVIPAKDRHVLRIALPLEPAPQPVGKHPPTSAHQTPAPPGCSPAAPAPAGTRRSPGWALELQTKD